MSEFSRPAALCESLREIAESIVDTSTQEGKTLLEAADELQRCQMRVERQVELHKHWRERAIAAEQALGLYGPAEVST